MKIQITHKFDEVMYNNILIIDLYTFSTTTSILLNKWIKNLYAIWWEIDKSFSLQERLNKLENKYLLIDDSVKIADENNIRINWHPIPMFYKNKLFWKKYSEYDVIYRSQNWTQAIDKNHSDDRNILIWSFVNFESNISYIKNNFKEITLFIAWTLWEINSDDLICAKYYEHFLSWNQDENNIYYKELIREMINSNNPWDFFIRYFDSIYWDILGFNLKLNLSPWVIKVEKYNILNECLYKIYLI